MDCVYLENDHGGVWQDRPKDVTAYTTIFGRRRALAPSPKNTITRLTSLL
jgi:hypothetical protein